MLFHRNGSCTTRVKMFKMHNHLFNQVLLQQEHGRPRSRSMGVFALLDLKSYFLGPFHGFGSPFSGLG